MRTNCEPFEIKISAEQRFILARQIAEQGGLFSAIRFDKVNPDIHTFLFNEWKLNQRTNEHMQDL